LLIWRSRAEKTAHEERPTHKPSSLISYPVCAENYGEPMYLDSCINHVLIMHNFFTHSQNKKQSDEVDDFKIFDYQHLFLKLISVAYASRRECAFKVVNSRYLVLKYSIHFMSDKY